MPVVLAFPPSPALLSWAHRPGCGSRAPVGTAPGASLCHTSHLEPSLASPKRRTDGASADRVSSFSFLPLPPSRSLLADVLMPTLPASLQGSPDLASHLRSKSGQAGKMGELAWFGLPPWGRQSTNQAVVGPRGERGFLFPFSGFQPSAGCCLILSRRRKLGSVSSLASQMEA